MQKISYLACWTEDNKRNYALGHYYIRVVKIRHFVLLAFPLREIKIQIKNIYILYCLVTNHIFITNIKFIYIYIKFYY